jgi:S-DNA-T family DNA segregation ATPase FtsK/SpoIIIE
VLVVFDELAYFSATVGESKQQKEFVALVRDLVARGRAAGIIVVAATQRPSADIIPTSLRDLFGYRWAFRCTTDASSDVILGHGWASEGYTAADIDPTSRGVGWLIAEGGIPRRTRGTKVGRSRLRSSAAGLGCHRPVSVGAVAVLHCCTSAGPRCPRLAAHGRRGPGAGPGFVLNERVRSGGAPAP